MSVEPDDRDNPARPGYAIEDRITLTTRGGSSYDSGPITQTRGDHDSPLDECELWTKFEDCLMVAEAGASARALFDTLMRLDEVSDARVLAKLLG